MEAGPTIVLPGKSRGAFRGQGGMNEKPHQLFRHKCMSIHVNHRLAYRLQLYLIVWAFGLYIPYSVYT